MHFTDTPKTKWTKLLLTKRDKLRTQSTIPRIEATWQYAEHPKLSAYQELFGFSSAHIPISYPQVLATPLHLQILSDPSFPFPALGIVHTHQKMRTHQPLTAKPFHIKSWVEGHRVVRSGAEFAIHTQVQQDNLLVWDAEMIILSRAVKGHGQKEPRQDPFVQNPSLCEQWRFPFTLGRKYAKVSGDYNPIHLSPLAAKIFGMPRHIIHGMYSVGKVISMLPESISEIDVSFQRPILLPSSVEFLADQKDFLVRSPKNGKTYLNGYYLSE